jgi:hypothetical protein
MAGFFRAIEQLHGFKPLTGRPRRWEIHSVFAVKPQGTGCAANIGSIAETQLSFDAYGPLGGVGGPVMSPLDFPKKTVLRHLPLRSCRMARR